MPDATCLVLVNSIRDPVAYRVAAGVMAGGVLLSSAVGMAATTGDPVVPLAGWQGLILQVDSTH